MRRSWFGLVFLLIVVGAIPASAMPGGGASDFDVVSNTGTLSLAIPVEAPIAAGGSAPGLVLRYSSQAPDGPFGVGWALDFGEIRRTTRFGTPAYDSTDKFEFQGELLVPSTDPSDPPGRHYTATETFWELIHSDGPGTTETEWEVRFSDGSVARYGISEESVIREPGGAIFRWLLAEREDSNGNVIAYDYNRSDPGTAYPEAVRYVYRRNGSTLSLLGEERKVSFVLEARPDPLISFEGGVEARLTQRVRHIVSEVAGAPFRRLYLEYSDQVVPIPAYATGRSRIATAQAFGSDCSDPLNPGPGNECEGMPARYFDYADASREIGGGTGTQWATDSTWHSPIDFTSGGTEAGRDLGVRKADVDGDGLVDLVRAYDDDGTPIHEVRLNNGSGWDAQPDSTWSAALASLQFDTHILELNVRELPDPVYRQICGVSTRPTTSKVYFAESNYWGNSISQSAHEFLAAVDARLIDVNGDGRADLVVSYNIGGGEVVPMDLICQGATGWFTYTPQEVREVWLNTGSGWVDAPSYETGLPALTSYTVLGHYGPQSFEFGNGTARCFSYTSTGTIVNCHSGIFRVDEGVRLAELNGDGRIDLIARRGIWTVRRGYDPVWENHYEFTTPESAWLNTGNGWNEDTSWAPPTDLFGFGVRNIRRSANVVDVNGDGLDDVLVTGFVAGTVAGFEEPEELWFNTGQGWAAADAASLARYHPPVDSHRAPTVSDLPHPFHLNSFMGTWSNELRWVDLNGDGLVDILGTGGAAAGGNKAWIHDPTATPVWQEDSRFAPPGDMTSITLVEDPQFPHPGHYMERGQGVRVADVDGDGSADLVRAYGGDIDTEVAQVDVSDRVVLADNGSGGILAFEYESAVVQRQALLESAATADAAAFGEDATGHWDAWSPMPLVSSATVDNGRGGVFTSSFAYARPRLCPDMRSGLGFRLVETIFDDGSSSRSFFRQVHGIAGQSSRDERFDAAGVLVRSATSDWAVLDGGSVAASHAGILVGRLLAQSGANRYGTTGADLGSERVVEFFYDDAGYGHNFVERMEITRPSSEKLIVHRTPWTAGLASGFVGFLESETHEAASITYRAVSYQYDTSGNLSQASHEIRDRESGAPLDGTATTSWLYDAYGNVTSQTDPGQRVYTFCYDGSGGTCPSTATQSLAGVTRVVDPLAGETLVESDPGTGEPVEITRHNLDRAWSERDPFGRATEFWVEPVGGTAVLMTSREFYDGLANGAGQPYSVTLDWTGATAEAVREAAYRDGFGLVERVVADGRGTGPGTAYYGQAFGRNHAGRVTAATIETDCGSDGHCLGLDAATSPEVVISYDTLGRAISVTSPEGTRAASYRQAGSISTTGGASAGPYDVVLRSDRNGNLKEQILDGDRLVMVRECDGSVAPGTSDLSGASCGSADETFYEFAPTGEVEAAHDAIAVAQGFAAGDRHVLRYDYDTLGRTVAINDPNGGLQTTTYNPEGTVETVTNARGTTSRYAYDDLDRLLTVDREDDLTVDYTITYDVHTRSRASVTETGGYASTYLYDEMGRLERETLAVAGETLLVDYGYDRLGRIRRIDTPFVNRTILYDYEGAYLAAVCRAETTTSADCSDSTSQYVESVSYDALGRADVLTLPGGTLDTDYYPDTNRPSRRVFTNDASDRPLDLTFDYDDLGNVESVTDAHTGVATDGFDATAVYAYDRRNRLEKWGLGTSFDTWFGYDGIGNLTNRGGAQGAQDQFYEHPDRPHAITGLAAGQTHFVYDADGNTVERNGQFLTFDEGSRLTCVGATAGACGGGTPLARFTYDIDGGKILTEASETTIRFGDLFEFNTNTSEGRIHYFAFGHRIATESVTPAARRTALPFVSGPLPRPPRGFWPAIQVLAIALLLYVLLRLEVYRAFAENPATASLAVALSALLAAPPQAWAGGNPPTVVQRWYLGDLLGSSVVVVDVDGAVIDRTLYEPFGLVLNSMTTEATDQLFTGQPYEESVGLYDYDARWYDPDTGRFLSVDPVFQSTHDPQTLNAYSYVGNNPVNRADPTGMAWPEGGVLAISFNPGLAFVATVITGLALAFGGGSGSSNVEVYGFDVDIEYADIVRRMAEGRPIPGNLLEKAAGFAWRHRAALIAHFGAESGIFDHISTPSSVESVQSPASDPVHHETPPSPENEKRIRERIKELTSQIEELDRLIEKKQEELDEAIRDFNKPDVGPIALELLGRMLHSAGDTGGQYATPFKEQQAEDVANINDQLADLRGERRRLIRKKRLEQRRIGEEGI